MKKLLVYADFDWLKEIELIGELSYESLRGSDSYAFQFNDEWLKRYGNLFISADLNNYTHNWKKIFSDASPMPCPIVGVARCSTVGSRFWLPKRNDLSAAYPRLIICWGLMIHRAWVDFASKRHPMETLSTQATPYASHH